MPKLKFLIKVLIFDKNMFFGDFDEEFTFFTKSGFFNSSF